MIVSDFYSMKNELCCEEASRPTIENHFHSLIEQPVQFARRKSSRNPQRQSEVEAHNETGLQNGMSITAVVEWIFFEALTKMRRCRWPCHFRKSKEHQPRRGKGNRGKAPWKCSQFWTMAWLVKLVTVGHYEFLGFFRAGRDEHQPEMPILREYLC